MFGGLHQSQGAGLGAGAQVAGAAGQAASGVAHLGIGIVRAEQFGGLGQKAFSILFGGDVRHVRARPATPRRGRSVSVAPTVIAPTAQQTRSTAVIPPLASRFAITHADLPPPGRCAGHDHSFSHLPGTGTWAARSRRADRAASARRRKMRRRIRWRKTTMTSVIIVAPWKKPRT